MNRQEAIYKIEYIRDGNDFKPTEAQVKALDMAIDALSEPKAGKWENLHVNQISKSGIQEIQECQCSECGRWHTTPYMYYPKKYDYCPNCGARMKGGAE